MRLGPLEAQELHLMVGKGKFSLCSILTMLATSIKELKVTEPAL
jgi:hypothetical protein